MKLSGTFNQLSLMYSLFTVVAGAYTAADKKNLQELT